MKKRIHLSVIAAVVLLVVATIAGCGGGSGGSPSAPTPIDPQLFVPNYVSSLDRLLHWGHLPVTVYFNLPADWGTLYQNIDVLAANEWNQPGKQALTSVVSVSGGSDVTVAFVHRSELVEYGVGTQGYTRYEYYPSLLMFGASVKVALDDANGAPISANLAKKVIAHELGHAIGIGGHSPNQQDLMFPTSYPNAPQVAGVLDLNTIMTAYPSYFTRGSRGVRTEEPPTGPVLSAVIE